MSNDWQDTIEYAERFRRELHQNPELSWQEFNTASKIRGALDELNIPWKACAETGTLGWNKQNRRKKASALR